MIEENKVFEAKSEAKATKVLNGVLERSENPISEELLLKHGEFIVLDTTNVMGFVPITPRARLLLKPFISVDTDLKKAPTLDYSIGDKEPTPVSSYGTEYLLVAVKFFESLGEKVSLKLKKDYPITLFNDDFEVIIAPRVGGD